MVITRERSLRSRSFLKKQAHKKIARPFYIDKFLFSGMILSIQHELLPKFAFKEREMPRNFGVTLWLSIVACVSEASFFFLAPCLTVSTSSYACHLENCPHSATDTGVHWHRSLRFVYRGKEFNLSKQHETMSKRVEEKENTEDVSYLNLVLGNIQFVYKEGSSFKTSTPFEIRGIDENNVSNPFFSNFRVSQHTQGTYIKFPLHSINEQPYKISEKLLESLEKIPLARYQEKTHDLSQRKANMIQFIHAQLDDTISPPRKRKKQPEPTKESLYKTFVQALQKNKINEAKTKLQDIQTHHPLAEDLQEDIIDYFRTYRRLQRKIKTDIQTHIRSAQAILFGETLFGEQVWQEKLAALDPPHSPQNYMTRVQQLQNVCEERLRIEEENLYAHPLTFATRRFKALQQDFLEGAFLPFNREQMLVDLGKELEQSYVQHSEQLFLHYVNQNFHTFQGTLKDFLRHRIGQAKIHGAFLNLCSTRDMCERCAVSLTIDHVHKNGISAKLKQFIQEYNNEFEGAPFVVYAVSSRFPYSTPLEIESGAERINSREEGKGIDEHSNSEKGRDVIALSEAHFSIQSAFFSHIHKELTEEQMNAINIALRDSQVED